MECCRAATEDPEDPPHPAAGGLHPEVLLSPEAAWEALARARLEELEQEQGSKLSSKSL